MIIESLLDTDLYKLTMMQAVYYNFPDVEVEYQFKCRSEWADLVPCTEAITREVEGLSRLRFTEDELNYLHYNCPYFREGFLRMLSGFQLGKYDIHVCALPEFNSFHITARGPWWRTILYEVPVLAIVNQVYFRELLREKYMDAGTVCQNGFTRLERKLAFLKENAPATFRFTEFGTRRRFSREWQEYIINQLCRSGHWAGTSNVLQAMKLKERPVGTMAHEWIQAFQALVPLPRFQQAAFESWMQFYRGELGIALTDCVGMGAFTDAFDQLFCKAYDGLRHDSGDPFKWIDHALSLYRYHGIDPSTKTLMFSDGLDFPRALRLHDKCEESGIRSSFGIGTNLTNDLGLDPLNIVMKMTECNGQPVAKLSDSPGKGMCKDEVYLDYLKSVYHL